jgi:hypothetical protein
MRTSAISESVDGQASQPAGGRPEDLQPGKGILIVPPEDFDGPLLPEELRMKESVFAGGVDYRRLVKLYAQGLGRAPKDKTYKAWEERPLSDFAREAHASEMEFSHRLLVLCDVSRESGMKSGDVYELLKREHRYEFTERSLRRQIAHARMALVLAPLGKIELLPSQNVVGVISALLPRHLWVAFLSWKPLKDGGRETVKRLIIKYASLHGGGLRGRPVSASSDQQGVVSQPPADGNNDQSAPAQQILTPTPANKLPKKFFVKQVEPELSMRVPTYHRKDTKALAKSFTEALEHEVSSVPRPARHSALDELGNEIARIDPELDRLVTQAARRLLLGRCVDTATAQAGAGRSRNGKK